MAQSRERTSFCSASDCQSFQPLVTMVITNINHSSDRSLSRPALTCSHCRWCTSFLQHTGPQTEPLHPMPRGCKDSLPDPGVNAGGRKWVQAAYTLSRACIRKRLGCGPRSYGPCQWWPRTRAYSLDTLPHSGLASKGGGVAQPNPNLWEPLMPGIRNIHKKSSTALYLGAVPRQPPQSHALPN